MPEVDRGGNARLGGERLWPQCSPDGGQWSSECEVSLSKEQAPRQPRLHKETLFQQRKINTTKTITTARKKVRKQERKKRKKNRKVRMKERNPANDWQKAFPIPSGSLESCES